MNFLGAVNRVLVNNLIIKGDDDLITSFSDNQHEGTIRQARNAITTELNNLMSYFHLGYEKTTASITTADGTRTYALPVNFVRFFGSDPYLYLQSDNSDRIYEYKGGEEKLRQASFLYLTTKGRENWWYWDSATTKKIAFYQVPDGVRIYDFEYEKDVSVSIAADTIPLVLESEAEAFADMASRRFKYLSEDLDVSNLEQDADYTFQRGTLMNLMAFQNPRRSYRKRYA